ncbi:hypothetical protein EDC56_1218 [Sinobacterium caligoides]|uniref:Phage major tail tube protein n=1 Tax=Sinobacterium caligoides TaxID=933926 RepID=A0A3N2E174_9GAMM|nr:phage major tail tube protein [Sinobacterium caligoides]ROS05672.1 hypothetical protein EDC56_1218 [Sinobacterium caligoides]
MIPKVLKNFNLFVDGVGYAGIVDELSLPKLGLHTAEISAAGMDAPIDIDMGMKKLTCQFTLSEYDVNSISHFGLGDGAQVSLKIRGALDNEEGVTPMVVTLHGAWSEVDFGKWKAGEKTSLKVNVSLRYYKLSIGGKDLVEVDVLNMKRIINGVDQLATTRDAIGI